MGKFNILYINSFSAIGGAENSLRVLVNNIDKKKFKLYAILPEDGLLNKILIKQGIEVKALPLKKLKARNPFPYIRTIFYFVSYIKKAKIDIVHCNTSICNQYALPAAILTGVPLICHVRTIYSKRAFSRLFLNYANVLIAISRTVADRIEPFINKPHKLVVIRNGIDQAEWSKMKKARNYWRRKLEIGEDAFVIGQFGRIVPEKGQDILIRAMQKVISEHSNVYCIIAGKPTGVKEVDKIDSYLGYIKKLVSDLRLDKNIFFIGFIQNMIELYDCINALVIPSRTDACGRTAIEAMVTGKPVIASAIGTAFEMITDNVNGFLFPAEHSDELAELLLRLINNSQLLKSVSENGRSYVQKNHNAEKQARRIEEIYFNYLKD